MVRKQVKALTVLYRVPCQHFGVYFAPYQILLVMGAHAAAGGVSCLVSNMAAKKLNCYKSLGWIATKIEWYQQKVLKTRYFRQGARKSGGNFCKKREGWTVPALLTELNIKAPEIFLKKLKFRIVFYGSMTLKVFSNLDAYASRRFRTVGSPLICTCPAC